MENIDRIYKYIDSNINKHLLKIQEFLRQPSISAEDYGIRETAELLRSYLTDLGCKEARIFETEGHPIVWGSYDARAQRTLLVYSKYDNVPVTGEKWSVPPFDARLVEIPPFGKGIMARGAFGVKGPLRAFLNAVESIEAVEEELPVNLKFVIEGEEEIGSPHFPQFVNEHEDMWKDATGVLYPQACQDARGVVEVSLGNKGIVYFELECSGEYWGRGPARFDIHSKMKPIVDSPVWRMIHALGTLTSEDGNHVLVEGFYDSVNPPSCDDLKLIDELVKTFDPETLRDMYKVKAFVDNKADPRELATMLLYSPTLNIDGISAGYIGPESATKLPYRAVAKLDVRLVPDQKPGDIAEKIRAHLKKNGYHDIRVRLMHSYQSVKFSIREDLVQAVINSYKDFGVKIEVWPHIPGSAPSHLFRRPLLRAGLGHGGRPHSPDEYLVIEGNKRVCGLAALEKSFAAILYRFGKAI